MPKAIDFSMVFEALRPFDSDFCNDAVTFAQVVVPEALPELKLCFVTTIDSVDLIMP